MRILAGVVVVVVAVVLALSRCDRAVAPVAGASEVRSLHERDVRLEAGAVAEPGTRRALAPATAVAPPARTATPERGSARADERGVLVIDPDRVPVVGATLVEGATFRANGAWFGAELGETGADGRARVVVAVARVVAVLAPGHAMVDAIVPPADQSWVVVLPRATRLEVALAGDRDPRGFHVEIALRGSFPAQFHQQKYVTTPGRCVDGTVGWWVGGERDSRWSLGFGGGRIAVVDQLAGTGTAAVALHHFAEPIARRELELTPWSGTVRIELAVPESGPPLAGHVVDRDGQALAGVDVRMAPLGGRHIVDPASDGEGFPCWAPATTTDAAGAFHLPRPALRDERLLFHRTGFADRVLTVAEFDSTGGRVELARGWVVLLEAVDRDGRPMDGGWSSGIAHNYARPSVCLGHDVWRAASPAGHPAASGRELALPWFLFADLPGRALTFRFTHLRDDEVLVHDARLGVARFSSSLAVDEMGIGK